MNFLPPSYKVIDRRLIMEVFVNTPTDNFKMQFWREPSKSKFFYGTMETIAPLDGFPAGPIRVKKLKVTKKLTEKQLAKLVILFYKENLQAILKLQPIIAKTTSTETPNLKESYEDLKTSYEQAYPLIDKRFKILCVLEDKWSNNEDTTEIVNINGYQSYTIQL